VAFLDRDGVLNSSKINNGYISKIKDFKYTNNQDLIFKEIYQKRDQDKIQIVDKNDFFLFYEIERSKKVLAEKNDFDFIESVKNNLFEKNKFDYNSDLLLKIQNKSFKHNDFIGLANNKNLIKKIKINSIKKSDLFTLDSIKLLYSLPENNFLLMSDKNNNVYLSKIENVLSNNLSKNTND
jgi:peptidyl-prolyl cis-trans isomerase D